MNEELTKLCALFLRSKYPGLKAGHAHELVAAFFGYKSRAALLAEKQYKLANLEEAQIVIPAVSLLAGRIGELEDLAVEIEPIKFCHELVEYLQDRKIIGDQVWLTESLGDYIMEEYLPENVMLDNELADVIASTNAYFDEEDYQSAEIDEQADRMLITVKGKCSGTTHEDKMFAGDEIDVSMTLDLQRVAARIGYYEPEISTIGEKRDYRDHDEDDYEEPPVASLPKPEPPISFGAIRIFQNGRPVEKFVTTPAVVGDHTGWRAHSIENPRIEVDVVRRENLHQRAFAALRCFTRFPKEDRSSWHNASYDMQPGVNRATVTVESMSLPMNFAEFSDTVLEIEFNWGAGPLAIGRFPVTIGSMARMV